MVKAFWNTLMDSNNNSLRKVPKVQRFQIMSILSFMWTAIFCANFGLFIWFPGLVLAHVGLLFLGIFVTGWIFKIYRD